MLNQISARIGSVAHVINCELDRVDILKDLITIRVAIIIKAILTS